MACVRDTPVILDVSSIMFVSCGFYVCSVDFSPHLAPKKKHYKVKTIIAAIVL